MMDIQNFIVREEADYPILCDLFLTDEKAKPIIIYCHGYKGFKDWGHLNVLARSFAESGVNFLKFNFSRNGCTMKDPIDFPDLEAFSENNYSAELDDVKYIINWALSETNPHRDHLDTERLFLMGHSRGGGIAILAASSDKRVKKLVTWSAVSDFGRRFPGGGKLKKWKENGVMYVENFRTRQKMPHKIQFFEDYQQNRYKLDISEAERSLVIPHLIIHGTKDENVYLGEALHLMSLNDNASMIKINGGTHTLGAYHPYDKDFLPPHQQKAFEYSLTFFSG